MTKDEFENALCRLIEDAEKTVELHDILLELATAVEEIETRIEFPDAFEPPAAAPKDERDAVIEALKREIGTWEMDGPDGPTTVEEFIDSALKHSPKAGQEGGK